MAKSYSLNVESNKFQSMLKTLYLIVQNNNYQINDYLLIDEVRTISDEPQATGAYQMTQINNIIEDEGLKDGYVMLSVKLLN